MVTLGLVQRHQHVRRLGDPRAVGVRLPVAVAALHHRLYLVETRLQTLGGILHPDVRPFHHLLGRQAPPGRRYQRRDGLGRGVPAVIGQHDPWRLLTVDDGYHVVGHCGERGFGRASLARRTRQRNGHQRLELAPVVGESDAGGRVSFRELFFRGDHVLSRERVLFGHRPDVQWRTGYYLAKKINTNLNRLNRSKLAAIIEY